MGGVGILAAGILAFGSLVFGSLAVGACAADDVSFGEATGGAGGSAGAASSRGSGGTTASGMTAMPCGDPIPVTASLCPTNCNGGCTDELCTILCADDQGCNAPVACPAGWHCQITCTGAASCRNEIVCNDDHDCHVSCNGVGACKGLELVCGARSDCGISCLPEEESCLGATVTCGEGACEAICLGNVIPELDCDDDSSCNCVPCPEG